MESLTVKQTACLAAIADHWRRHEKAPTVAQIAIKLGINRASAHRLMSECRDKGYANGPVTQGHWELTLDGITLLDREDARRKTGRELGAIVRPKKKRRRA